jgi:hypothetical protein
MLLSDSGDILRRQLEGAVEVLEAAMERYREVRAILVSPRWAARLVRNPGLTQLQVAAAVEPQVQAALQAVERRRATLPVATKAIALRAEITALASQRAVTEALDFPDALAAVQKSAECALSIQRTRWWSPARTMIEITLPETPERVAEEMHRAAHSQGTDIGMDPADDDQEIRLRTEGWRKGRFAASTARRYDRTGGVCEWSGRIQGTPGGSLVRSRIGLPLRRFALTFLTRHLPPALFLLLAVHFFAEGPWLAIGICGLWTFNTAHRLGRDEEAEEADAERLLAFATRLAARFGAKR